MKIPLDNRIAPSQAGGGAMMIGMDGSLYSSRRTLDEDGEHALFHEGAPPSKNEDGEHALFHEDAPPSENDKSSGFLLVVLLLMVATAIGFGGYFTARSVVDKQQGSPQQVGHVKQDANQNTFGGTFSPACEPGMIKDTMEPMLELYMIGPTRLTTAEETVELEKAILAGFNEASAGCNDRYERWMYGVEMVNQTLLQSQVLNGENGTGVLENRFEDEYAFVARFQTIISCDGCSSDSAFASEYPTSFGNGPARGIRSRRMIDVGRHGSSRESPGRSGRIRGGAFLSDDSGTMTRTRHLQEGAALNAGNILVSIENAIVDRVDWVEAILVAKIVIPVSGETYQLGNSRQSRNVDGGGG